jgi:hypothetical protein
MAGPWEDYAKAATQKGGPWEDYKAKPESPSLLSRAGSYIGQEAKGFNAGVAEATPFVNLFDKGAAAAAAGTQSLFDLFRNPENQGSFGDRYQQGLNLIKNQRASDIENAPRAAGVGKIVGAAAPIVAPFPGANIEGAVGVAARTAGMAGLSGLEAGTRGEKLFDPEEAQRAALVAGGLQGGLEAAIPVAGKIAGPIIETARPALEAAGNKLEEIGAGRAVKAALGNAAKAWRAIGGPDSERATKVGEQLLSGEAPVVTFGANASKISDKAAQALGKTWEKINAVHEAADAANIAINGEDIASKILDAASKIKDVPQNQSLIDALQNQALHYEMRGAIPLSEAQELKNQYSWTMPTGNMDKDILGKQGHNAVKQAIGNSMKETIAASELPGKEEYPDLLQKYGAYASAAGPAAETALREAKNRSISLTDYLAGNIGANVIGEGTGQAHGITAGLFALANKIGRERGNSSIASTAYTVGKALQNAPEMAQKYGTILSDALTRGPAAFMSTHAILLNGDPQYRAITKGQSPGNVFERRLQNGGR